MFGSDSKPGVLRLAVMISGGGSTMANLQRRIADGRLARVRIDLVISSRGKVRGVELARELGLPLEIIRRIDHPDETAFSDAIVSSLDCVGVDLVVMGGFMCFWRIPQRYAGRVLNIHPALLPDFGGKGMYGHRVHEAVLSAGVPETGCTVHLADNEYDHGPRVAQRRVSVLPDDTPDTLVERVQAAERELYPQVIQQVADQGLGWLAESAGA